MPIYEYRCAKCSAVFEALVRSMSDARAQKCPRCGGKKTEKLMSVFAAQGARSEASSGSRRGGGTCGSCHGGHCSTCGH